MVENFIERIISRVKERVKEAKRRIGLNEMERMAKEQPPPFTLRDLFKSGEKIIIAEVKRASPSKGLIREFDDPREIVDEFIKGGADAVSVLTEVDFFKGSVNDLKLISDSYSIPLLRKDFILDHYQVAEARAFGADFYLLIAEILDFPLMKELVSYGRELGMEPLIEFHSEREIEKVLKCEPSFLGINNRDLKTFKVDVRRSESLSGLIPRGIYRIAESGIKSDEDILRLSQFVDGFLIGERLLIEDSPSSLLKKWKKILRCDKKEGMSH